VLPADGELTVTPAKAVAVKKSAAPNIKQLLVNLIYSTPRKVCVPSPQCLLAANVEINQPSTLVQRYFLSCGKKPKRSVSKELGTFVSRSDKEGSRLNLSPDRLGAAFAN
jgi:hypothetical protein